MVSGDGTSCQSGDLTCPGLLMCSPQGLCDVVLFVTTGVVSYPLIGHPLCIIMECLESALHDANVVIAKRVLLYF